ncbi:MAG: oligoendopeptidase F [Oscillospiraceae bacterium]|nr:oligoendopeptidase F [Oscillospiraceae bacterium]
MAMNRIPERNALQAEDQWNLADLYPTDAAWQQDFDALKALVAQIPTYRGRLAQSAQTLMEYVTLDTRVGELLDKLMNYAQRKSDEDTRVSAYQAMVAKLTAVWVEAASAGAFETPEIMAIPDETLEAFFRAQPALELYRRAFFNIRRKRAHVLSDTEEKLLAQAGEMAAQPDNIFSMFNDADLQFPDAIDAAGNAHPLSQGAFGRIMESGDRVLRKSAFENFYRMYGAYRNTLAAVLASQVKQLQFFAQARHYPSPLHHALDGNNVPVEVYYNLIEAVHHNMDKMHRYVQLRKKLLGVDELHMYDVYAPLVDGVAKQIPFDAAKKTVYDALAVMGEQYRAILRQGYESHWIDVYENVGKRSGAYSAGPKVHPYVLLNYTGTLDSVFTLAHEMGHAIHSYLSNTTQSPVYSEYVIFVAEVASTCNETLLMYDLLEKTTDKKERAYLINHFLEQFKGTLYRQTMFAEFELKIAARNQEGESLTAEDLCALYRGLNEQYFGSEMVLDPQIDLEWSRIPHFYYNYYVFQYATGFSAAIALARRIRREGKPAVEDYMGFLRGGCSKDPIDLLKGAGVDMTTAQPVEEALALFGELLDEMQQLTEEA